MAFLDPVRRFLRDSPVPAFQQGDVPSLREIETPLSQICDHVRLVGDDTWALGLANRNSTFEATYREHERGGTFLGTEIARVAQWPSQRRRADFNEALLRLDSDDYGRIKFDESEPPRVLLERRFDRRYLAKEGIASEIAGFNLAQEATWLEVRRAAEANGVRLARTTDAVSGPDELTR